MPLLFHPTKKKHLARIRTDGLPAEDGAPVRCWTSLEAARAAHPKRVLLVVEGEADGDGPVEVEAVPPGRVLNLDPYLPVGTVEAGGGYVLREGRDGPEVLMIFRRGFWDLPKGKLDPGETPEEGALREVREEVGIDRLELLAPAGRTVHGYPRDGFYWIKTTHWFLMRTPERDFTPQAEEQIERVEWVPWDEAQARVGFESLRRHMAQIEAAVREDAGKTNGGAGSG